MSRRKSTRVRVSCWRKKGAGLLAENPGEAGLQGGPQVAPELGPGLPGAAPQELRGCRLLVTVHTLMNRGSVRVCVPDGRAGVVLASVDLDGLTVAAGCQFPGVPGNQCL